MYYFYIYPPLYFWCLESSFSRRVSGFHNLPSLLHDISSRCVMREAGLILLLTCFHQPLWTDQQMKQSGVFTMLQSISGHASLPCLLGHSLEENFLFSVLTLQIWRPAGPELPALAATSNARQLASEHSIGGPSASWEIQMGICLLKLLVGCLLCLPEFNNPPFVPGIPLFHLLL